MSDYQRSIDTVIAIAVIICVVIVFPIWWRMVLITFEIINFFPIMYVLAPLAALEGTLIFFWMYPEELPKRFNFLLEQIPQEAQR